MAAADATALNPINKVLRKAIRMDWFWNRSKYHWNVNPDRGNVATRLLLREKVMTSMIGRYVSPSSRKPNPGLTILVNTFMRVFWIRCMLPLPYISRSAPNRLLAKMAASATNKRMVDKADPIGQL